MSVDPNHGRNGYVEHGGTWMPITQAAAMQNAGLSNTPPSSSGIFTEPVGKGVPLWVMVPIWAGLIWAFKHFPVITQQSHWSGPLDFSAIIIALMITAPRLRIFAGCFLLPFTIFGTWVIFMTYGLHPINTAHKQRPSVKQKPHKHQQHKVS